MGIQPKHVEQFIEIKNCVNLHLGGKTSEYIYDERTPESQSYCKCDPTKVIILHTVAGTCGYGEEFSGSINAGNFLTSDKVYWLASQEGLCSME